MNCYIAFYLVFMFLIFQSNRYDARRCEKSSYFSKEGQECLPCKEECASEHGMTKNCGHNSDGDRVGEACRACPMGTEYSKVKEYRGSTRKVRFCVQCTDCKQLHRAYKRNCTSYSNSVCGDCLPGYYRGRSNSIRCSKCSKCCLDNKLNRRMMECINSGVSPSCSCTQDVSLSCKKHMSCEAPKTTTLQTLVNTVITSTEKLNNPPITIRVTKARTKSSRTDDIRKRAPQPTSMSLTVQSEAASAGRTISSRPTYVKTTSKLIKEGRTAKRVNITKFRAKPNNRTKRIFAPTIKSLAITDKTPMILGQTHFRKFAQDKLTGNESITKNKIKIKIGLIAICTIAGLVILSVFVACVIRLKENKKSTRDRSANEDLSKRARAYSKSSSVISSTTDDQTTLPQQKESDCSQQEEESYFADIIIESIPENLVNRAIPFVPGDDQCFKDVKTEEEDAVFLKSDSLVPVLHNEEQRKILKKTESSPERLALMSSLDSNVAKKQSSRCNKRQPFIRYYSIEEKRTCANCTYSRHNQCSILVEDLKTCQKKELQKYLDVEHAANANWKEVAVYFKVNEKDIGIWEMSRAGNSPTSELLYYLSTQRCKVEELVKCFVKIGRLDVKEGFLSHFKNGCQVCNSYEPYNN